MTPELIFESAIRASVLALGAWGLLRLLRIRSADQERLTWLAVLVAAAVMPVAATIARELLPATGVTGAASVAVSSAVVTSLLDDLLASVDVAPWSSLRAFAWPLYLCVTGLLLARLAFGLFSLARIWRRATPLPELSSRNLRVRSSASVHAPVTIGAGILLPAEWTQWTSDVRDRVLMHETSHVGRGDFWWQLLTRAHLAVFWASPLSWWLLRRLTLLAEHLSDDAAVASHGRPIDYAACLLELAGKRRPLFMAVAIAPRSQLALRIERILRAADGSTSRRPPGIAVFAMLSVLVLLSTASPWFTVAPPRTVLPPLPPLPALQERLENLEPLGTAVTP